MSEEDDRMRLMTALEMNAKADRLEAVGATIEAAIYRVGAALLDEVAGNGEILGQLLSAFDYHAPLVRQKLDLLNGLLVDPPNPQQFMATPPPRSGPVLVDTGAPCCFIGCEQWAVVYRTVLFGDITHLCAAHALECFQRMHERLAAAEPLRGETMEDLRARIKAEVVRGTGGPWE